MRAVAEPYPAATTKLVHDGGKASHNEVRVIRGGGEASDAKRMADRQSDTIGAASNTRDQDDPSV
jgi:hypothetical protein